jgi:hypothetical protein
MIEVARPAGDMSRPGVPDIVLYQDLLGGSRVSGDRGGGRFDVTGRRGDFCLAAPNFATSAMMEESHQLRALAFPMAQWTSVLDEAADGRFSFENSCIYGRMFDSPTVRSTVRNLWALSEEEGAPSRLLARAAGGEILAELCRLGGAPLPTAKDGVPPGAVGKRARRGCRRPGSFGTACIYGRVFYSSAIRSTFRRLWSLCEEEGAPSRLLARAAGCEILAELCRLGGAPFTPTKGGLAPWAERRCLDLMKARLSEDIGLEDLAAEARLSPFHFARMFKQSLGVPPRVYLTRLRVEKACDLLERTDLSVTEIALGVGYS